jgi:hypothetical protein
MRWYTNATLYVAFPGYGFGSWAGENSAPFTIGTSGTCQGLSGSGWIDELAVYNRALSLAEIQAIYRAGAAGKCHRFRILVPPDDQVIACGSDATFSVVATNELGSVTYQWQFNGIDIAGATTRVLTVTNAGTAQAGIYTVVVRSSADQTLSASARLGFSFLDLHMYAGLTIRGRVGSAYRIEATENLEPPIQWQPITNIVSLPTSPFVFIDFDSVAHPRRYYRAVSDACP